MYPTPFLSIQQLTYLHKLPGHSLSQVSFDMEKGEVFGIYGKENTGQTELMQTISGIKGINDGNIYFEGEDITSFSFAERIGLGFTIIVPSKKNNLLDDSHRILPSTLGYAKKLKTNKWNFIEPDLGPFDEKLWTSVKKNFIIMREEFIYPKLVLFIEPFWRLDEAQINLVCKMVSIMSGNGTTTLLCGEDSEKLENICGKIAILHKGQILCVLQADQLKEFPISTLLDQ